MRYDALRFAAAFFAQVLRRPVGAEALAYLKQRSITDATIELFGIGYAPPEWDALLGYARSKGIDDDALVDAGLVRRRDDGTLYDMFRGRIVFPIHDAGGRVVGFGARAMGEDQPKYLNSPDGPFFHKGRVLARCVFGKSFQILDRTGTNLDLLDLVDDTFELRPILIRCLGSKHGAEAMQRRGLDKRCCPAKNGRAKRNNNQKTRIQLTAPSLPDVFLCARQLQRSL